MNIKVKGSEWLNERGNRSYNSNYVFPKDNSSTSDLYLVCGAVGAGVMYRGEQVAEQVVNEFVSFVAENAANFDSEADAQAELLTSALAHAEKQLSEYIILHPECHGIATTLACVHYTKNGAIVGWIGDTRAVLIRNGMLVRQSNDHSTKYPYDDFSLHPRRSINRMIEGTEKPASMDVAWWNDLQPDDIIALGTYAVMRPLEQGFLSDAWERESMRDGLKFACDAHARDNYAIYTMRMGEGVVQTVNAEDTLAAVGAAPLSAIAMRDLLSDDEHPLVAETPSLESETAEIEAETPSLETETAEIEAETPSLETETAEIETETPSLETETAEIEAETPSLETETAEIETETPSLETETAEIETETPNLETETAEIETETPSLETETAEIETETAETVVETPKTPIIGGNYAYDDDEDEKTGTGFIWSPNTKTEEPATTETEEPVAAETEEGGIGTNVLIGAGAAVIGGGAAIIGGGAAAVTNAAGAAKDAIGNIVDFTPVTDKDKAKNKDAGAPVTAVPVSSGFGRWGIAIAACLLGVAVMAWLSTFIFGKNDLKQDASAMMTEMYQKLDTGAKTREDSLKVYNEYVAKAKVAGIDTAEFVSNRDAYASAITIAPPAEADPTGADGALAENGKQAVTEASVATNIKPQIAQNTPTNGTGDKPASDAAAVGAKPATPKTEEEKVAGSVKPKVTVNSKAPAPGNTPAPVMQGRMGARPASYSTPTSTKLPPVPKTDVWKTYDKAWAASEGFRAVKKGDKWGWMREDGKPFVGLNYEEVGSFKDGMAPLKKGGKWSFTTTAGKRITDYKFTTVTPFGATCPGLAKVSDGKKLYYIDKTGKEVPACK